MTLTWRYVCDGEACSAVEVVPALHNFPVGWLHRVISDRIESLDEPSTGTGMPGGRSEVQRQLHYCGKCRRKVAVAKL